MSEEPTVYICEHPACGLGTAGAAGRFTGGSTALTLHLRTGQPLEHIEEEGEYGEGYCPNCGTKGRKAGKGE